MKAAAKDEADGAANMTANKRLQFQIRLSYAETEASTCSMADTEQVTNQLEREIYAITSNDQKRFKREFSIYSIEFEACWETIGIQALRKYIEQRIIHLSYPKMHLQSHILESIWRMGSGDNFATDIAEWLHIATMKEACGSTNKVHSIREMLKHNDQCTGLDYMEETLSYLALQGWYNIDWAKVFNQQSGTDKRRIPAQSISYMYKQLRMSPISALYHSSYIIWEKPMSTECVEVSNSPRSEMHCKTLEFPTLDSYSASKLNRTADTKLVHLAEKWLVLTMLEA